ncbi:PEP/pyruvate-binding domain-containing protein [Nitrospinaceae bacterium]|nr:PEP/pyruvate-binding domain-containing protein [Nitrospinaceae bacterium]
MTQNNMATNLIKLGSGDINHPKYSFKAKGLDLAVYKNLFVPQGYLIPHEILSIFKTNKVERNILTTEIQTLFKKPSIAIRSAFSIEDHKDNSFAGVFDTVLSVDKNDPEEIINGLTKVLKSSRTYKNKSRLDILVMEMVNAKYSGVAFTESQYEDDQINWTEGLAAKLVSGQISGEKVIIPKLKNCDFFVKKSNITNDLPFYSRLQLLLKKIRSIFGNNEWDIEWADDGTICWLLQIRPITRSLIRNDLFDLSNHKEILPPLPSVFMNSLITECSPNLFKYYQELDPQLPSGRLMVESFRGLPYFNISLLSEMLRKWGLPTKLLRDSMGGSFEKDYGLNFGRIFANWKVYLRILLSQIFIRKKTRAALKKFKDLKFSKEENIPSLIQKTKTFYTTLVFQMLIHTMAIAGPIALLRYFKTLNIYIENHVTPGTGILKDLTALFDLIKSKSFLKESLSKGNIPNDDEFIKLWKQYLEIHGHRGIYESDISQPRFRENYEHILKLLLNGKPFNQKINSLKLDSIATLPIWWILKPLIYSRENIRYEAMKTFESIRDEWLNNEKIMQKEGLIPNSGSIWNFKISELRNISPNNKFSENFYKKRIDEIAINKKYNLPNMIKRNTFLAPYKEDYFQDNPKNVFHGLSLTEGTVKGRAWVIDSPKIELPNTFNKQTTILIAPATDAGWIPTFSQVSGAAIETGGDLSHGSIILRELQLPAITNAKGIMRNIKTGDIVSLIASEGVLSKE